jgi:hypothetical protein
VARDEVYECEVREWVINPVTRRIVVNPLTGRPKVRWHLVTVERSLTA